jgi:hypothetical protein
VLRRRRTDGVESNAAGVEPAHVLDFPLRRHRVLLSVKYLELE